MSYVRPGLLHYRTAQAASWLVSKMVFRRKFLRNEIKSKKGPFVVIANHQAALDFVNLIGATNRPMSFVISNSFYSSLPLKKFMDRMGVIPKQQFQTTVSDMKRLKAVVDAGEPLVLYPAGLMCEDGLSTPIPGATYKFLKWLDVDVYVARTTGSYFVMPKWAPNLRPGRTYMDIYQLFSAEELKQLDVGEIRRRTDEALLFDAYAEQQAHRIRYSGGADLRGLENVVYMCPHCEAEYSIRVEGKDTLRCDDCGFAHRADATGLLENSGTCNTHVPHISQWSRLIMEKVQAQLASGALEALSASVEIQMIASGTTKFQPVGEGTLTLSAQGFCYEGSLNGKLWTLQLPIGGYPTLPFKPGKYLEIQDGSTIYRCVLKDGRQVMKFIHLLKLLHQNAQTGRQAAPANV